jgi:hypothetical protein
MRFLLEYGGEFKNQDWFKKFTPDDQKRYLDQQARLAKKKEKVRPQDQFIHKDAPISTEKGGVPFPLQDHHVEGLSANEIHDPEHPSMATGSHTTEEIGQYLHERGSRALQRLGVEGGQITGPNPHTDNILIHTLAHEVKGAMKRGGKVGTDWYTTKFKKAMKAASDIYPELAKDKHARMAFTAALAVTSQGEKVGSNVNLTDQVYSYYRQHGKFPENIKAVKGNVMSNSFKKLNYMLKELGPEGTHKFLHSQTTVRELENMGHSISGENKDTKVHGSSILGPKIGGGFFQNLNGNFDPVTMDLWFMRSWGRLTGTLTGGADTEKSTKKFVDELKKHGLPVPKNKTALNHLANMVQSKHEHDFKVNRADYDSGKKEKSKLTNAAIRHLHNQTGLKEIPGGGKEREWMRDIVNKTREKLAKEGHKFTNADLQAVLWYPEKELYAKLGGKQKTEQINVDYHDAIKALGEKKKEANKQFKSLQEGKTWKDLEKFHGSYHPWQDEDEEDQTHMSDEQARKFAQRIKANYMLDDVVKKFKDNKNAK